MPARFNSDRDPRLTCLIAAMAGLLLATSADAQTSALPSTDTVAARVAAATQAAGSDLKGLMSLCTPAPATRPSASASAGVNRVAVEIARPAPAPGMAFDNLAYVGGRWSGAWALQTSEGAILLDALNNAAEAKALVEGGMLKLGLDPAKLKLIVVSHAHGDHYGGAPYLIERYGTKVVMSEADWRMSETALEFTNPLWPGPPKRGAGDRAVNDGDSVTLGDTTLKFYITGGHTLGTLSTVFDVKSGANTHRAMLWGGTAFNFGRDIPRMDLYIAATARMAQIAKEQGISVMLSNHPDYDGTVAKLPAVSASGNPFVIGTPTVVRALTVMGECAQAQRDRYLLMP